MLPCACECSFKAGLSLTPAPAASTARLSAAPPHMLAFPPFSTILRLHPRFLVPCFSVHAQRPAFASVSPVLSFHPCSLSSVFLHADCAAFISVSARPRLQQCWLCVCICASRSAPRQGSAQPSPTERPFPCSPVILSHTKVHDDPVNVQPKSQVGMSGNRISKVSIERGSLQYRGGQRRLCTGQCWNLLLTLFSICVNYAFYRGFEGRGARDCCS